MSKEFESQRNSDNRQNLKPLQVLRELREEISFSKEEIRAMIQDSKGEWGK